MRNASIAVGGEGVWHDASRRPARHRADSGEVKLRVGGFIAKPARVDQLISEIARLC